MAKRYLNELANVLIEKHAMDRQQANAFLATFVEVVRDAVAIDKVVKVKGLGTFKVIDVESRESISVNTGERVVISGHQKLTFTADNAMKELVNRPFAQFETVVLNEGVTFDAMPDETEPDDVPQPADDVPQQAEAPTPVDEVPAVPVVETPAAPVGEEPVAVDEVPAMPLADDVPQPADDAPQQEAPADEIEAKEPEEPVTDEEPMSEEVPMPEEVPMTDEEPMAEDNEAETEPSAGRRLRGWWIGLSVVACLLCFAAGYLLGRQQSVPQEAPAPAAAADTTTTRPAAQPADTTTLRQPADTMALTPGTPSAEGDATQQPPTAVGEEDDYQKYEEMDARVRTGAYNIIGVDHVVVVKEGDNLGRIARRTLGAGMECYIEVYNGINSSTQLTPGQEIKIPKLRVKESVRRRRQAQQGQQGQ